MQYLKRANRLIVAAKRPLILEKKLMWLLQFSNERITLILCKAVFKELLTEKIQEKLHSFPFDTAGWLLFFTF
jgi:hypothetical protein